MGVGVNPFDAGILSYVNGFAGRSHPFDLAMGVFLLNHLVKVTVLVVLVWWAWFTTEDAHPFHREHLVATLIGSLVAVAVGRGLAMMLPFRLRPVFTEQLHFVIPYGVAHAALGTAETWSSFPSDHAMLCFALAVGLLFVSKKVGVFALIYSTFLILLPRLYFGMHYPTDVIFGAAIGTGIAVLANVYGAKSETVGAIVRWSDARPSFFYPVLFVVTYQIAETFDSSRELLIEALRILQSLVGSR
jgi:undecaprenyl-diphosphatase